MPAQGSDSRHQIAPRSGLADVSPRTRSQNLADHFLRFVDRADEDLAIGQVLRILRAASSPLSFFHADLEDHDVRGQRYGGLDGLASIRRLGVHGSPGLGFESVRTRRGARPRDPSAMRILEADRWFRPLQSTFIARSPLSAAARHASMVPLLPEAISKPPARLEPAREPRRAQTHPSFFEPSPPRRATVRGPRLLGGGRCRAGSSGDDDAVAVVGSIRGSTSRLLLAQRHGRRAARPPGDARWSGTPRRCGKWRFSRSGSRRPSTLGKTHPVLTPLRFENPLSYQRSAAGLRPRRAAAGGAARDRADFLEAAVGQLRRLLEGRLHALLEQGLRLFPSAVSSSASAARF